jgi:hypothetical protein
MPTLGEPRIPIAACCELHRALQWIKSETPPVDRAFEAALGIATEIEPDEYRVEFLHLFARLWEGELAIEGRPSEGGPCGRRYYRDEIIFSFGRHGDFEEIPVEKIRRAGSGAFNIRYGNLRYSYLVGWVEGEAVWEAWEYVDLRLKTADLFRAFPPLTGEIGNLAKAFVAPPAIALPRSGKEPSDRALAACATEQTLSEQLVGGPACGQPPYKSVKEETLDAELDSGSTALRRYWPAYLQLAEEAIAHFGITDDHQPKVGDKNSEGTLVHWFLSKSEPARPVSESLAAQLATIVRRPESRLGGARPQRARTTGALKGSDVPRD